MERAVPVSYTQYVSMEASTSAVELEFLTYCNDAGYDARGHQKLNIIVSGIDALWCEERNDICATVVLEA